MQAGQPMEGATGEPVAPHSGASEAEIEGAADEVGLRRRIEELSERAQRLLANWQRAQADLSNYRRQAEREREELTVLANASLVADLLPILDDLERALGAVAPPLRGYTWVDGIWLILKKLEAILTVYNLEEVKAQGMPLDPHLHQVVAEVDGEAGMVVQVVQKGYLLRHRLLRPALVTVGRGPKPTGATPGTPPAQQASPPQGNLGSPS